MDDNLRALFPITERAAYLNHAAISPPPLPVTRAVSAQIEDVAENGSLHYRRWVAVRERARKLAAEMIGARPEQLAFMRNTSDGLSTIANGLRWREGENSSPSGASFRRTSIRGCACGKLHGVEVRFCEERDGRVDVDD